MKLFELFQKFKDEEEATLFLEKVRWPDSIICPECHRTDSISKKNRDFKGKYYCCWKCRANFSTKSGTIFHHTILPMDKWFRIISLFYQTEEKVNKRQLSFILNVSYLTITAAIRRIQKAFPPPEWEEFKKLLDQDLDQIDRQQLKTFLEKKGIERKRIQKAFPPPEWEEFKKLLDQDLDQIDRQQLKTFLEKELKSS